MVMSRSNFSSLLVEGLRDVYFNWLDQKSLVYPDIYEIRTSKKQKETDRTIAGIDMLSAKAEGEPITYDEPILGYDKVYTHTSYAKGIRMTRELMDDELYGVMKQRAKALGRSARYRTEYDHAQLFINATSTSEPYCTADAAALLSASHTRADGGANQSNIWTSTDLSLTALEAAFTAMRKFTDDRGLMISVTPRTLLIPPDLEFDAIEMLNSPQKAYTADNEINVLKTKGLNIVVWDMLTDTDSWFVLTDKGDAAPQSFKRTPVEFENDGDFDTKDLKVSAYTRYSYGATDWRWVYGSLGAA